MNGILQLRFDDTTEGRCPALLDLFFHQSGLPLCKMRRESGFRSRVSPCLMRLLKAETETLLTGR